MTKKAARWTFGLGLIGTVGAILLAAALLPLVAESKPRREIVVVAKDMAFYVDGVRNPAIQVEPGERVTLTFVNEDPGFEHDFAIPAWSVATPLLAEVGRTSIELDVPTSPQATEYICSIHNLMMVGRIEVRAN